MLDEIQRLTDRIDGIITRFVDGYSAIIRREKELGIGLSDDEKSMEQWCEQAIVRNNALIQVLREHNNFLERFKKAAKS